MTPADELAIVRARIAHLRKREAALTMALIAMPPGARDGQWTQIDVVERRLRLFDHRLLPPGVRDDPAFWRDRDVTEVRCTAAGDGVIPAAVLRPRLASSASLRAISASIRP